MIISFEIYQNLINNLSSRYAVGTMEVTLHNDLNNFGDTLHKKYNWRREKLDE
jgi:hypothetical protein